MNERMTRGAELAGSGAVKHVFGTVYRVRGNKSADYVVDVAAKKCECPDRVYRNVSCKHIYGAALVHAA